MQPLSPWQWRSLPSHNRTGSDVFESLFLNRTDPPTTATIGTLLESPAPNPKPHPLARYSICAGPPRVVNGIPQVWTPAVGSILPLLRQLLARGGSLPPETIPEAIAHLPFTGGWLGWLGYDLAWEIERLPQLNSDPLPFPVAYWYEPDTFAVLDYAEGRLWLAARSQADLDLLERGLDNPASLETPRGRAISGAPQFQMSQSDYESAVRRAKAYIQAGDIFQANLSLRFEVSTRADRWQLYRDLHRINPSPFASYWQTPWGNVVSCSPERLVKRQGSRAETRPIAGTRPRAASAERDRALEQELTANLKERAEHIMLVDLERNDLGRVCQWGSVRVDELLTVERYSHVMHLVSNVTGVLQPDADSIDLIRALFPGGTITGCPKVRCMEIIEELEPVRRSLFYGSCGYLDWRGQLDLNILIRTLLTCGDRVWGQVGAGIVADSDPEREWHESMSKARAQLAALGLTPETIAP
ncbi:MAG: anthranilate synthase component I [Cyanobacteria bacterium J007]|nr:MAG: anthranilate synthase component I [Cyanobacteria bacterium J007]